MGPHRHAGGIMFKLNFDVVRVSATQAAVPLPVVLGLVLNVKLCAARAAIECALAATDSGPAGVHVRVTLAS